MLPGIEVYSIDEAWGDMSGIADPEALGRSIRERLAREIGMPVGVGISTTKTLAKLANWASKKWKGTGGVLDLTDLPRQEKLLRLAPVSEVWGVGHRSAARLAALNISTAWDLAQFDIGTLRKTFGVTMERTARELRGISCIDFSEGPPPKEAICSSKMFGVRQTELSPIREAMAAYVSRVKTIRAGLNGVKTKNVMNLEMNKSRPDSKNPENGVRLEVSIWSHEAAWFKGIQEEDEIVVLGMWKHSTKAPEPAQKTGRFKTFTNRRLSLTMVLKTQVSKIEDDNRNVH